MKIFVIKGNLKGIVKVDSRVHLFGNDFDKVSSILLFNGVDVKVLNINELSSLVNNFNVKSVVLLDDCDNVIGAGSIVGKVDINKILIAYNLTCKKSKPMTRVNSKENPLKIETKLQNEAIDTNYKAENDVKTNNEVNMVIDIGIMQTENTQKCEIDANQNQSVEIDGNEEIVVQFEQTKEIDSVETIDNCLDKKVQNECCQDDEQELMKKNDMQVYGNSDICDNGCLQEVYSSSDKVDKIELKEEIYLKDNQIIDEGVQFIMQNFEENCNGANNFYLQIKEDLQKFLSSYPKNEELENKVWGSKWIKINDDPIYSVGVIFDEANIPSIIAYAIPYEDYSMVDESKLEFCEWLQIEEKPFKNRGYLVYYQNAQTGEMLTK